ncbi:hypothetical protein FRC07_005264, partial [Ceratobasidium sp. 392]
MARHQQQQRRWQPLALSESNGRQTLSANNISRPVLSSEAPFSHVRGSGKRRISPYQTTGGSPGRAVLSTAGSPASNAFLRSIQSPLNLAPHLGPWNPVSNPNSPVDHNHVLWDPSLIANHELPQDNLVPDGSMYLNPDQELTTQEDEAVGSATAPSPHSHLDQPPPNSNISGHNLISCGTFESTPSQRSYLETYPDLSANSFPTPIPDVAPSSSSSAPTHQFDILTQVEPDSRAHSYGSPTTAAMRYLGVSLSPELEL